MCASTPRRVVTIAKRREEFACGRSDLTPLPRLLITAGVRARAVPPMTDLEAKRIPKFKRSKITQLQLNALLVNFGASLTACQHPAGQNTPGCQHLPIFACASHA